MNESTPICNSVELIPLETSEVSPLIDRVKIKVFHLGRNRNGSYIDKETALDMAKSLRGNPIVGAYKEENQDFTDHGQKITIEGGQVKVECVTKPYGFVDLNAEAWFEDYEDIDEFGNKLQHTYLVTEGVVWRGQFPELEETLFSQEGRPQSMELDEKTLKGNWSTDYNNGVDFFIISEALISKLCILGEETEPCFLGSSITPINTELNFSLDKNFFTEMYSMMKELKEALKGEPEMENEVIVTEEQTISENFEISQDKVVEENMANFEENVESTSETIEESLEEPATDFAEAEAQEEVATEAVVEVETEAEVVEAEVEEVVEVEEPSADFKCKKEYADEEEEKKEDEESKDDEEKASEEEEKDSKEENKKYSLLEEEYEALKVQFAELEQKYQELVAFKAEVENKEKDTLINSFSMLSDAEKADVIENKSKYSFDEIESKLSVAFTRKQMAAAAQAEEVVESKEVEVSNEAPMLYSVHEDLSNVPDWVKAVLEKENN